MKYLAEHHQELKPGKKKLTKEEQKTVIHLAENTLNNDLRYFLNTEYVNYICDHQFDKYDYCVGLQGEFGTRRDEYDDPDDEYEVEQDREFEALVDYIDGEFFVASVDAT